MAVGTGTAILGGSLISGMLGNEAAGAQGDASAAAIAEQRRQFDLIRGDTAPYRQAGVGALSRYNQLMGLPTNNVLAAPQQPQTTQTQYGQPGQPLFPGYLPAGESWATGGALPSYSNQFNYSGAPPQFAGSGALPEFAGSGALPEFANNERLPEFNFNLEADPGYQFARDEAIKATTRGAARQGYRNSGNVLAEIGDRVTGVASQYANDAFNRQTGAYDRNYRRDQDMYGRGLTQYGLDYQRGQDAYGRRQDYLNRLGSIAGIGQSAVTQSGNAGMQMAGNVGNALMAQGQANADRYGSWNNAIQGGISNYLLYDQLGRR